MVFTPCPRPGRSATLCTPGGERGSFLLADGTGVCIETQSASLPALRPCCTCKHCRVMGSVHMLRASPGQLGCVYASQSGPCWCPYVHAFFCDFYEIGVVLRERDCGDRI